MELLSKLAIQVYAHIHGHKIEDDDTASSYAEEFGFEPIDDGPDGRSALDQYGRVAEGSYRYFNLHSNRRDRGIQDRSEWGTYMESAPPVLPLNACLPGFDSESTLVAQVVQRRLGNEGYIADIREPESSSDEDDGEEEGDKDADGVEERDARNLSTRDLGLRDIFRSMLRIPTTSTLSFAPSSSLFGSTTRPASRTLYRLSSAGLSETLNGPVISHDSTSRMVASRTHLWVSLWFLLTAPVIFWDAGYCFMRPRSFKGGDLHWIWKPYEIYQEVDYVYGVEAYNRGDGFASAQSFLNVIETFLNLYYVYAQHMLASPVAPLVGFAAAVMTLSKTVLYWAQEYYCGGCAVGHNDLWTLFWFWIVPNGLWLIFPTLIIRRLALDISAGLTTASKLASSKKK